MGGEQVAQRLLVGRGRAEGQLEMLGPGVVAVQRIVGVGAEAAVQMLRGLHDPAYALGGPDLGDRHVPGGRQRARPPPVVIRHAACHSVASMARRSM